jgi:CBS domain-containing protein
LLRFLARVETLPAEMPLAAALEAPLWKRVLVVPVVDRDRRPMGTVTLAALREASRGTDAGEQAFETVVDLAARFLEVLGGLASIAFGGSAPEGRATDARRTEKDVQT